MIDEIIEKRFKKLIVKKLDSIQKKPAKNKSDYIKYYYLCECDCGNTKVIEKGNILSGHTTSCGCSRKKSASEHQSWKGFGELGSRYWSHIKSHAKSRSLNFNISINQAWEQFQKQNGKCALTGWDITLFSPKNNHSNKTASLDRIDSSRGYEKDNIQWVHKDVNYMKGKFTVKRFIEICVAVSNKENICY